MNCQHARFTGMFDHGKAVRCIDCGHRVFDIDPRGYRIAPRQTRGKPPWSWPSELYRRQAAVRYGLTHRA